MFGNDHWTLELDLLGMKATGDELARRAVVCRPPYAICVQGKWGSGKTSLMRYAMARLGGESLATTLATNTKPTDELPEDLREAWGEMRDGASGFVEGVIRPQLLEAQFGQELVPVVVPVWFNPWQHQQAELPVVGLLREIRSQFTAVVKLERWARKLTQVGVEAALPMLDQLAGAIGAMYGSTVATGGSLARVPESFERYEKRHFEQLHDAQRLNLLFEEAVRRLLGSGAASDFLAGACYPVAQRRLVIFIDDLDRCAESQTVHLLEAIKLYLQTPYCVFVLGMDGAAARRAIAKVLGQGGEVAREYLEKLFQATLHVPLPRGDAAYVEKLLAHAGLDPASTGLATAALAARVVALIEPNPRKLKSFVSTLATGWTIDRGTVPAADSFSGYLLLTYLRSTHPDVYRLLAHDAGNLADLNRLIHAGSLWAGASPVAYFLHRSLRHAQSSLFAPGQDPSRDDSEGAIDELVERLDHLKGDRELMKQWKVLFSGGDENRVFAVMAPLLRWVAPE